MNDVLSFRRVSQPVDVHDVILLPRLQVGDKPYVWGANHVCKETTARREPDYTSPRERRPKKVKTVSLYVFSKKYNMKITMLI